MILNILCSFCFSCVGLYVDANKCRESLSEFSGDNAPKDHDALLRIPNFYPAFVQGEFTKTFRLIFCRSLSKSKMVGGFAGALHARCDDDHQPQVLEFLDKLFSDDGVNDNDMLTIVCHDDAKTVEASFLKANSTNRQELFKMESGGEGGIWLAFQNLYFDDQTAVPTIRHSAVSLLPNILSQPVSKEGDNDAAKENAKDSESDNMYDKSTNAELVEEAIVEQFVKSDEGFDWSGFAGREGGKKGYKFGDLTRGVTKTVFNTGYSAVSKTYNASIGKVLTPSKNEGSTDRFLSVEIISDEDGRPTDGNYKGKSIIKKKDDEKDLQIKQHLETIKGMDGTVKAREHRIQELEGDVDICKLFFLLWTITDFVWSIMIAQSTKQIVSWIIAKLILCVVMTSAVAKNPDTAKKIIGALKGVGMKLKNE